MDVAPHQRQRRGTGVEVDTDHHPVRPHGSAESDGHRRRPATEINQTVAGTYVWNEERGDRVNRPARVGRTMPLPQERLVGSLHVHQRIIADPRNAHSKVRREPAVPDAAARDLRTR
jgi:hypothetical protein